MLRESERKERNYQLVNINLNTYYIRQQYSYYSLLYSNGHVLVAQWWGKKKSQKTTYRIAYFPENSKQTELNNIIQTNTC